MNGCLPIKKKPFVYYKKKIYDFKIYKEVVRGQFHKGGWLTRVVSHMVMVKKTNRTWRRCTDFTNLSNACLKDCFLLHKIDQLVDGTIWHEFLSF